MSTKKSVLNSVLAACAVAMVGFGVVCFGVLGRRSFLLVILGLLLNVAGLALLVYRASGTLWNGRVGPVAALFIALVLEAPLVVGVVLMVNSLQP